MSMFILKLIAIITMTIDHIGVMIFPQILGFRIIGRLAFVLFAFLIVNGYKYTKNRQMYLVRLIVMAFISQIPDMIGVVHYPGNIFFTLSIGLGSIMLLDKQKISSYLAYILLITIACFIEIDYGLYGVLTINAFYFIDKYKLNPLVQIIIFIGLNYYGSNVQNFMYIQYYSMFSLVFIWLYNGKLGYNNKLLSKVFYWYYPVHIGVIYLVSAYLI